MSGRAARRADLNTKRHAQKARQRRNRQRPPAYQQRLVAAIRLWFPAQFFSQWTLIAGLKWTPQRLFWMGIFMAWSAEQTLADRFEAVRDLLKVLFPKWSLGKTFTGWCDAQTRWLAQLRPGLVSRLQRQMRDRAGKFWTRQGWCAFAADGSRVECPRTGANEALGCAGRKKTGPQLFLTTLWHMGTGLPWDFRIGPGTASERGHVQDMLAGLPPRSLLVADAGFTGYEFYQRILMAGHHFLTRVGSNVRLLRRLGLVEERGDTVYLWPEKKQASAKPLVLRLIVLNRGQDKMYLLTNVLEKQTLPLETAALLYEMRWGIEVFYRSTKQTLQKRRMLSETPTTAECELTWAMLAIWLLGLMTVSAILQRGGDPLRYSVARARSLMRRHMRRALKGRQCRGDLTKELATATKDDYRRQGNKKARNWPHKKKEKPPGAPKLQLPTSKERRTAKRLIEKRQAA